MSSQLWPVAEYKINLYENPLISKIYSHEFGVLNINTR